MEFVKRQQCSQQWLIQLPATYQISFFKGLSSFCKCKCRKTFKESSLIAILAERATHAHTWLFEEEGRARPRASVMAMSGSSRYHMY